MILTNARQLFLISALVVLGAVSLAAQSEANKNDVGLVIGATTTPSVSLTTGQSLNFNSSLALGAEYDRQFVARRTAVYAGIDFLASPFDVKLSYPPADVPRSYAYLFLTPHVRVKFNGGGAFEPWLLFGGGYARFSAAPPANVPAFRGASNSGALEFGGGVDSKPIVRVLKLPIGIRLAVRDFYSGTPNYNQALSSDRQNNVVYTGGLLIRF
jgi:hypothetical protein